jgi:hypothetical protein
LSATHNRKRHAIRSVGQTPISLGFSSDCAGATRFSKLLSPRQTPPVAIAARARFSNIGTTRGEPFMKSILDPSFRYTPSEHTDLRKTFARIRREQRLTARSAATGAALAPQVLPITFRKQNVAR